MFIFRLILLIFIFFSVSEGHTDLRGIRTADREEKTVRIVFDVSKKQDISYQIDQTSLIVTLPSVASNVPIQNQSRHIRLTKPQEDKIIFSVQGFRSLKASKAFWIPASDQTPLHRFVMDLKEETSHSAPLTSKNHRPKKKIIIDAGHGGKDPGTIGIHKIYEKNVTLTVAKRLAKKLTATGRYTTVLLRSNDSSLTLAQRLRMARASKGDLFISLHADSCDGNDTRGLSIYTLSAVASDRQAERLAKKENKADLIMGIDLQAELPEVANILIDLTKRETMNLSTQFAQCLLGKLRDRVFLLRKPHRFADFFILKSADLPSVLIELGYLSNPKEALLLTNPNHQEVICEGIVEAIDSYFSQHT